MTKAQRLERGSNIGWRITVRPDSDSAVTIILPETTDCGSQGAICTEDGGMLSHRLELTVSGPWMRRDKEGGASSPSAALLNVREDAQMGCRCRETRRAVPYIRIGPELCAAPIGWRQTGNTRWLA